MPKVKIEVVIGSKSDFGQMEDGLALLKRARDADEAEVHCHVISCHRNLKKLMQYAHDLPNDVIVIAGAGMAAALPGVLKTMLNEEGKSHIPVIGVAFKGKTKKDNLAARLSIECLPGQPVHLKPNGKAHYGPKGFADACRSALYDEFIPMEPPTDKPALFDLPIP
ncbi:MAG: AIR carboxylase family protein [Patescibacteria group bacterium]|jgi:phosphoribosylcarboxyaminoimidazole (NCAIR) mutase